MLQKKIDVLFQLRNLENFKLERLKMLNAKQEQGYWYTKASGTKKSKLGHWK